MDLNFIIIANGINFVGAVFLLIGHFYLFKKENTKGFFYSAVGSFILCNGSFILNSWPVLFLDFCWVLLSIYGLFNIKRNIKQKLLSDGTLTFIGSFTFIITFVFIFFEKYDEMGWLTSSIYLIAYYLLSINRITLKYYLSAYIVGFFILIPHVLIHFSYSILVSEFIAASMCVYRLIYYKNITK
jgi:hypothetical protein